jgi:hypothetical protein
MEPEIETYSFSAALELMKLERKMSRLNWNKSGQYASVVYPAPDEFLQKPYFFLFNAQKERVMWVPSNSDLLANDWVEIKEDTDQLSLQL